MTRLIDLHVDWPLQYAGETTLFEPALYPDVAERLPQAEGYLGATSAAVVACFRRAEDWAGQADPWRALGELLARIEAEFSGRMLVGRDDLARWEEDPEGLTWAVVGVEGFDALIRSGDDLDRLPGLFERGVRVFQPIYGPESALGGSSAEGDDRGLAPLGRDFLEALSAVGSRGLGPRPILDLAHLNPAAMSDALGWFEADADRPRRVLPVYSHGAPVHPGFERPRGITRENLTRLRALGGVVGIGVSPPFFELPDQVKAAVESAAELPFLGRPGVEGIAIGTDFLGVRKTLPGLGNAEEVVSWLGRTFDQAVAESLIRGNARKLIGRAIAPDGEAEA